MDCNDCTGENCGCFFPGSIPIPAEFECEPIAAIRAPASAKAQKFGAAPLLLGKVRVPIVSDPTQWRSIAVPLDGPYLSVPLEPLGWNITFLRNNAGPAQAEVVPATIPAVPIDLGDKVLSASVVLPEAGGEQQYWVPVTQRVNIGGRYGAVLLTPRWTVIFLRDA